MTIYINNPKKSDIDDIELATVCITSPIGEQIGTFCNSIISISIKSTNGFYGNEHTIDDVNNTKGNACSIPYAWYISVDSSDGNIYVLAGRNVMDIYETLKELSISAAYQGLYKNKLSDDNVNLGILYQICGDMGSSFIHEMNIYSHNLDFDFQHLRNDPRFNDMFASVSSQNGHEKRNTFSRTSRHVMKSRFSNIVGKCSISFLNTFVLTKKSLKDWAKDECINVEIIENKDIKNEIKTPKTKLSEIEINFAKSELEIITYGMRIYRDKFGQLNNIPLTQTGIVRKKLIGRLCENERWARGEKHEKNERAKGSRWSRRCCETNHAMSPSVYAEMRQLFTGGSMIMNSTKQGKCVKKGTDVSNLDSYDFNSAYICVLTHMLFPIEPFSVVKKKYDQKILESNNELMDFDKKYIWYGHFIFHGLRMKKGNALPSQSVKKCISEDSEINCRMNGKIISAKRLNVYLTDIDFWIFNQVYEWDEKETIDMWSAKAELLPKELMEELLLYFKIKTMYKDVPGKESLYSEAKQFGSSVYGAAVTRLFEDETVFSEDGWGLNKLDAELYASRMELITPKNTFLPYQVGVWVTAWCRYMLWQFALPANENVLYGDTDSLIGGFNDSDRKRFSDWEDWMDVRRGKICSIYDTISQEDYRPKKYDGTECNLGAFEHEHSFEEFKFIGIKKYVGSYLKDGILELKIAMSGLPNKSARIHINTPSDLTNKLTWNEYESKLLSPVFDDNQPSIKWVDRDGNVFNSNFKYGVCMKPSTFSLTECSLLANVAQFIDSGMWCNMGLPESTDPLFIRQALDKKNNM